MDIQKIQNLHTIEFLEYVRDSHEPEVAKNFEELLAGIETDLDTPTLKNLLHRAQMSCGRSTAREHLLERQEKAAPDPAA